MSERLRLPGSAQRGPCPKCGRDVAFTFKRNKPYGHRCRPVANPGGAP